MTTFAAVNRLGLLLLQLALLVSACRYPNPPHDLRIRELIDDGGDGFSLALFQSVGVPMHPGNAVDLIENGRIFDAIEEEILNAHTSIHLDAYIWRPGVPSTRLLNAIRARRPGVSCRIVYDPFGSVDFEFTVRRHLSDAGCDVRAFRPYGTVSLGKLLSRSHRKVLVIDGRVGITGGFGIWRSWDGHGVIPDHWRDTNVRVLGPAVRDMQLAFAEHWQEAGGPMLPPDAFPPLPPMGTARAAFIASSASVADSKAERMTQLLIAAAHHRLWIANSYFIPSTAVGDTLIAKVKRGIDVRVLVPGPHHDLPVVRAGQRSTYERLLREGVRLWEYGPSMYHGKSILVDDRLVVIGSTNLDPLAMRRNEEGSLIVDDPELAAQLAASWQQDLPRSIEIRWDSWRRRGLLDKLSSQLTSLVGQFL